MSIREIYEKFDLLKSYIDLADQELRAKASEWGVEGETMIDIIGKLPF